MTPAPPPGPLDRPGRDASLRERVLRRDAYRCVYCAEQFREPELTLDHVEPRMRGGDQSEGNLVAACRACNAQKGATPAWAYLAERPLERANFLLHATAVWPRLRRAVEEAARKTDQKSKRGRV